MSTVPWNKKGLPSVPPLACSYHFVHTSFASNLRLFATFHFGTELMVYQLYFYHYKIYSTEELVTSQKLTHQVIT